MKTFRGNKELSKEENLNLLNKNNIIHFMKNFQNIKYDIKEVKLLGIVSNLIIIIKKNR